MKHRSVFYTIYRTNLRTFISTKGDQNICKSTRKETKNQIAEAQKIYDVVRVRRYDMKNLLGFDMINSNYLIDKNGPMGKPNK